MLKSLAVALVTAAAVLAGSAMLRADPAPSKARWEYKVVQANPSSLEDGWTKQLNDLAADGWELDATFHDDRFVLRRSPK